MTVCLEKSRETARDLSVTINYSETSPAEAQGKIKVELLVKTTILCRLQGCSASAGISLWLHLSLPFTNKFIVLYESIYNTIY